MADEYHVSGDGPHIREKVKKGHYISGLLVKLLDERRVYVVTRAVKDDQGVYMLPKVERFLKTITR